MGCGASAQVKPANDQTPERLPPTIVLVIGLEDASGIELVCKQLCNGLGCMHLDLDELLRSEVQRSTALGAEISAAGRTPSPLLCSKVVLASIANEPCDVYLLSGYPRSTEGLASFEQHFGAMPCLALYLEISEDAARRRLALDETAVRRRLDEFGAVTDALLPPLERHGLLCRINAEASPDDVVQSARSSIEMKCAHSFKVSESSARSTNLWLVIGGPGVDAARHASRLASKYGCVHLSVPELMRKEVEAQSSTGRSVSEMVRSGKIVPTHLTIDMIRQATSDHQGSTFLLDGFPRTVASLSLLEEQLCTVSSALYLQASEEVQLRSGVGGAESDADSEVVERVRRQIRTFNNQTLPVISMLEGRGIVKKVDASGGADKAFHAACKACKAELRGGSVTPSPRSASNTPRSNAAMPR